eukprot:16368-Heterococcus_DN1.PRE.3
MTYPDVPVSWHITGACMCNQHVHVVSDACTQGLTSLSSFVHALGHVISFCALLQCQHCEWESPIGVSSQATVVHDTVLLVALRKA